MGLSRLNNFLKSSRGTILYVDPSSFDSTDSIENLGNSLTRPFKTIQRALIEAARFSYQRGLNNDRFNKTTILVYPGDHLVDNRPGYIPTGADTYSLRNGATGITDLNQWETTTNLDLSTPDNALYKLNSIHGGVIVPRGTSIVGLDLRKTRIRPTYVPNPENDNIERSCIFRVTGSCYLWQYSVFDADPNGNCYKDYTGNLFVPNFSHHKLAVFEYADGVNPVNIKDTFLTYSTTRTDLDMYYEKVAAVYGPSSGREITPDYSEGIVDIQPSIDEYRIVGPKGKSVEIISIFSGDGVTPTSTITVNIAEPIEGLSVDSPIEIRGVGASGYDGQYVISTVLSGTQITYKVQNPPIDPLPTVAGSTLSLVVDTVTSASPYIFNISLRSAWGMCGLLADGDKATGFKSMVVAQFTGIGLQKDEKAFVIYDPARGNYKDYTEVSNLNTNSRSRFKPTYENYHIKATNDAFLQLVSVFAIGYANHIVTENGGDVALNNSNSNFGAKALISTGFKRDSFIQDDFGYITHIIPPKEIESKETTIEFAPIDISKSISVGSATTDRLYLYGKTNRDEVPTVIINGYHIGAKKEEKLYVEVFEDGEIATYSSNVVMPSGNNNSNIYSSEKIHVVDRSSVGINSISANLITLKEEHSFSNGESVRIISDDAHLPDGILPNQLYYVCLVGVTNNNQLYLSKTVNAAISGTVVSLNNKGGVLSVVSRVSDKNAGEIGHPVQWDNDNWYITVSSSDNQIYDKIKQLGTAVLGNATGRSYITRKPDSRNLIDTLYRVRYVLPKDSQLSARPPVDGYILQESSNILGNGQSEISQLYNPSGSISNYTQLRNPRFIANATWTSNTATITSELPHNLNVGDEIKIVNVLPSVYNGTYTVTSIPNPKQFTYSLVLTSIPSSFANNTSDRSELLPYFARKKYNKIYQIYRSQEVQPYVQNIQDGIYYLTLVNHSNYPTVSPFTEKGFSQPVVNLYPQTNVDNSSSDPKSAVSHALPDQIGTVVIDDLQNSITKETLESFVVGFGITNIQSSTGTSHTIYTSIDHGLSGITSVSILSSGINYGSGSGSPEEFYNAKLVSSGPITGSNATAKVYTDISGQIIDIRIIDGGSAYAVGDILTVTGIAVTTGNIPAVVKVDAVSDNINDTVKIFGISSSGNSDYNNFYRISSVSVGKPKEFNVISSEVIDNYSTTGLGIIATSGSKYVLSDKAQQISSLTYNSITGLATIVFGSSHGLDVNQKIRISGANESVFNGDFIIKKLNSDVSLVANIGITTTSTSATGTVFVQRCILSSHGGDLISDTEATAGRLMYEYDGVTTTTLNDMLPIEASPVSFFVDNAVNLRLDIGDYLLINSEIFRIKETVTSNLIVAFRATLGSPIQAHTSGSVVRRIKIRPVELRRNSIIRASGHTFEYLGFGPGNYSTALPEKQDRVLTNSEKFLSQSTKSDGGIIVYTGMNSDGDFFAGNKKINSATGKEETFDTPFPTITGEKDINNIVNVTDTQKLFVSNSIRVEGGKDKNTVSEFDGPVIFDSKVTSNADIETNNILIQGDQRVSRKFSISDSKPSSIGNYGDIVFNSVPSIGKNVGWVYVTDNSWTEFGNVSPLNTSGIGIFSQVGIATTSPINSALRVGAGNSLFVVDADGVGIGTTANGCKLRVNGDICAETFYGDGSNLVNLNIPSSGWSQTTGGIYNTNLNCVGIGTTNPTSTLTVLGDALVTGVTTIIGKTRIFGETNIVGLTRVSSGAAPSSALDIGAGGNGSVYMDLYGYDGTGSDYASRIIRWASNDSNASIRGALELINTGTGDINIKHQGTGNIKFITGGSTRFVVKSNGSIGIGVANPSAGQLELSTGPILLGTSSKLSTKHTDGSVTTLPLMQVAANVVGTSALDVYTFGNVSDKNRPLDITFNKTRSNNILPSSIILNNDRLGAIVFNGADGTTWQTASQIVSEVDGSPNTNSMPGRLAFYTTPSGSGTSVERMRIDNTGNVGVGSTVPQSKLDVYGDVRLRSINSGQLAGFRNVLINGGMTVSQYNGNNAVTLTAGNPAVVYPIDRWYAYCTGANTTCYRWAGAIPGQNYFFFNGSPGVTKVGFGQRIEKANSEHLAGTTVTLSADIQCVTTPIVKWFIYSANSADTFGTIGVSVRTIIASGQFSVGGIINRYSATINIPSTATNGIEILFTNDNLVNGGLVIGNVQLEPGSVATPFERRNYQTELAMCQRYYTEGSGFFNQYVITSGATVPMGTVYLPVTMRSSLVSSDITLSTTASTNCSSLVVYSNGLSDRTFASSVTGTSANQYANVTFTYKCRKELLT